MKSLSELTEFYYENLHPILENLDKKRENVKFRVILFGIALFLLIFLPSLFLSLF